MSASFSKLALVIAICLVILTFAGEVRGQTGHILNAAGPVHYSMGGASTAMPLDGSGALFWNPATMMGLPCSELDLGLTTIFPSVRLSSSVAPGAFGPGVPPSPLAGSNTSDVDFVPVPDVALVWREPDCPLALGLAVAGVAGFGIDYAVNPANPVASPPLPVGLGLGGIYSDYRVLQVAPSAAYQLTECVSVSVGPVGQMALLAVSPFPGTPPDDANGDGFATYPSATRRQQAFGIGFQVGAYYSGPGGVHLGAVFRSPVWYEPFHLNSADELGRSRAVVANVDYPMVVSFGVGYSGLEHFRFAADFRYVDYQNTDGFRRATFDRSGALTGLGWDSMFVTGAGMQYAPGGPLSFRLGYSFNTNPIPEANTFFNVAAPSISQHTLYCGVSYEVSETWVFSLLYGHGFKNSITGPFQSPAGPVPGTSVTSELSSHAVTAGLRLRF